MRSAPLKVSSWKLFKFSEPLQQRMETLLEKKKADQLSATEIEELDARNPKNCSYFLFPFFEDRLSSFYPKSNSSRAFCHSEIRRHSLKTQRTGNQYLYITAVSDAQWLKLLQNSHRN